jgi:molybdenum cofactor cytidylyltransferase
VIAGILLAAGGARRFGSQKLVQSFEGQPLVRHAAAVLAAETDRLVVVVGTDAAAVRLAVDDFRPQIVHNEDWSGGLSTSLRRGIDALAPDVDAAVICLGDQPRIDRSVIRRVIAAWREGAFPIVSARYRGTRGHPVLFDKSVFSELERLEGDAGARMLIERDAARVAYVNVDANVPGDVDSPSDLAALQARSSTETDTNLNDSGDR